MILQYFDLFVCVSSVDVYCSYVEDGPNLFWCQLKIRNSELDRMASEVANAPRNPITSNLSNGRACIAQSLKYHAVYRAVIREIQPGGCRVTFIDYGNSEFVPITYLYEIPRKFLEYKTFALPFELHGCKSLDLTSKPLLDFFGSLVGGENILILNVIQSNNMEVQQCKLFVLNGTNVLGMLGHKMSELSTYAAAPKLKTGIATMANEAENPRRPIPTDRTNSAISQGKSDEAIDVPQDRYSSNNKKASNSEKFCSNLVKNEVESKGYDYLVLFVIFALHAVVILHRLDLTLICFEQFL